MTANKRKATGLINGLLDHIYNSHGLDTLTAPSPTLSSVMSAYLHCGYTYDVAVSQCSIVVRYLLEHCLLSYIDDHRSFTGLMSTLKILRYGIFGQLIDNPYSESIRSGNELILSMLNKLLIPDRISHQIIKLLLTKKLECKDYDDDSLTKVLNRILVYEYKQLNMYMLYKYYLTLYKNMVVTKPPVEFSTFFEDLTGIEYIKHIDY